MRAAGVALRARFGARAALVKGGHLGGDPATLLDVLVSDAGIRTFTGPRLPGAMRGTGDALGTALAAPGSRRMCRSNSPSSARARPSPR